MSNSRLIRGTFLLTAATMISRVLGLIYYFPFIWLVGIQGAALYAYAYNPYVILLSVATVGLPLAVSKFVSKYNALGDYRTGRKLFRSGIVVMLATGFVTFLMLFLSADAIAPLFIGEGDETGNSLEDVAFVIKVVSFALLAVPVMSLIRGYFQGFESMGPTATSQVVEQIVRIAFILVSGFIIVVLLKGDRTTAVAFAVFAAFIGALGGLAVLFYYWRKRKPHLDKLIAESTVDHQISLPEMYKELISYAIPFVIVGLAIPIYQQIDTMTMVKTLKSIGMAQVDAEAIYATVNQTTNKIIMIPVSLATALGLTLIPTITKTYTSGNLKMLQQQITQTFQMLLFLTLPAVVGLAVLSYPAYGTLYGMGDVASGGQLLRWYAPTAVLFALFTAMAAILQGINQQKLAVLSLLCGILIKLLLNTPFIEKWGGIGAILATDAGYLFSVVFCLLVIKKMIRFRLRFVAKRALLISIFVTVMGIAAWLIKLPIELIFSGDYGDGASYFEALLSLIIGIAGGSFVYLWLSIRSHLAGQIFGHRFAFLNKKVKSKSRNL
ncbi:cell division protein [Pueribacillus theae]|uniref:Cell division protein n=1 Tax=Pueribacillus theae TaxID=2171751 RepID=A0A2U1JX19_9BACI|nr:polysaccharide biosynthesis protein [Pueribacillus theae]PWA09494.1 cell division protein [Pueribacillus theae]